MIIRKHKFKELALSNSIEALEYLQTKIFEIIDHSDTQQTREVLIKVSIYLYNIIYNIYFVFYIIFIYILIYHYIYFYNYFIYFIYYKFIYCYTHVTCILYIVIFIFIIRRAIWSTSNCHFLTVSIVDVDIIPEAERFVGRRFSAELSDPEWSGVRDDDAAVRACTRRAQSADRALRQARGILPGIVDATAGESDRSPAVIIGPGHPETLNDGMFSGACYIITFLFFFFFVLRDESLFLLRLRLCGLTTNFAINFIYWRDFSSSVLCNKSYFNRERKKRVTLFRHCLIKLSCAILFISFLTRWIFVRIVRRVFPFAQRNEAEHSLVIYNYYYDYVWFVRDESPSKLCDIDSFLIDWLAHNISKLDDDFI